MSEKLNNFFYSIYEQSPLLLVLPVVVVLLLVVGVVFLLRRKKKSANKIIDAPVMAVVEQVQEMPAAISETVPLVTEALIVPEVVTANIPELAEKSALESLQFKANILIIEDDAIMLLAIRSILAKSGYNLVTAKDGKEAFEELEKGKYDVVVTDLMMPYANGLEVVSTIRNDISKRHVGIIVCSSVGNEETITEAFRLGADDYLKKPIKTDELLSRIKKLLERRMENPKLVTKKTAKAHV